MAASISRNVFSYGRCLQTRIGHNAKLISHFCTKPKAMDQRNDPIVTEDQNASGVLHNVMQSVAAEFKNKSLLPKFLFKKLNGNSKASHKWEATVSLSWPEPITTSSTGLSKVAARRMACWQALQIMRKLDAVTEDFKPCLVDKEQLKEFSRQQNAPQCLSLSCQMELRLKNFITDYKELCWKMLKVAEGNNDFSADQGSSSPVIDVITGRPLSLLEPCQTAVRNDDLLMRFISRQLLTSDEAVNIRKIQQSLPIHTYKDHILLSIENNPVVIVSGETGCGKTTQLPQYILKQFAMTENGSKCNIVVTQPRRLAAVSVAKRVAFELNEQLGDTVGYQVRLSNVMPRDKGAILFCTGGILLQRLVHNPDLDGVSHVVIDEAHERSVITDFTLVLLKDLVKKRPSLRVIIMSASMNVGKLSNFFDGCPIVKVPGFTHPITEHFLPEILSMMEHTGEIQDEDTTEAKFPPPLNYDFIAELIYWLDHNRQPGGILCFLPGWQDISAVQNCLKDIALERGWTSKHTVIPLHSHIPVDKQSRIFEKFPEDERKIVLATNIAETSITVPDVTYVIDSGRCKDLYFNSKWGASSLQTQWISQANVQQRRGRAGRTHPGECFHLYPKEMLEEMEAFPVPEIRRTSLEKVILDAELYCENQAEDFLARCPDPPYPKMVNLAMKDLYERGFLTFDMKLTRLGQRATTFPCHPFVAKAILFGRWMRCQDPLLTIAAYLSADKRLFRMLPDERQRIHSIKKSFAAGIPSDYWAVWRVFEEWEKALGRGALILNKYYEEFQISKNAINFMHGIKRNLLAIVDHMQSNDELNDSTICQPDVFNQFCRNPDVVASALAAGFSPNFLRRMRGSANNSRIMRDKTWLKNSKRVKTHLMRDSVNYKLPPELMSYLHMMQTSVGYTTVRETFAVSPFAIVLLTGQHLFLRELRESEKDLFDIEDPVVISVDENEILSFCCSRSAAELLCEFRSCILASFQYSLSDFKTDGNLNLERISTCDGEALAILNELCRNTDQNDVKRLR